MIKKSQSSYRLDIQGLRALAVLAVIINHFSKTLLPNGFLGVDIFFVISGFVITSLLSETAETPFRNFITIFYERRIKRLFPSLILCVVLTALVSMLFIAPWQNLYYGPAWHTGFASLAGLSNMYLLSLSVDYFGGSAELNPFTQTWSLGVEEQFYLLYPILFWSVNRYFTKGMLLSVMAVLSAASLVLYWWVDRSNPSAAFYLMPTRFWQLGLGCIAFLVSNRIPALKTPGIFLIAICGTLIFLGSWPLLATLLVAFLTVGLLVSPAQQSLSYKILSSKPAIYIGAISYPLYLWHWSVLSLSRWTIGVDMWTAPAQLALIFILAAATHKWLETPLKKSSWAASKGATTLVGLAALGLATGLVFLLGSPLKGALYSGTRIAAQETLPLSLELSNATETARMAFQKCNLTPDDLTGADYHARPKADEAFYRLCLASQKPKIILTGDSFSTVIAPHIAMIAARMGYDYRTVMGYGCPFPFKLHGPFAAKTNCNIDIDFMRQQIIANVNSGDIVVLRLSLVKPQYVMIYPKVLVLQLEKVLNIYDEALEHFRIDVEARGGNLILIGSNLTQEFSPSCLNHQWFNTRLTKICDQGIHFNSSVENQFSVLFDRHFTELFNELNFFSVQDRMCDKKTQTCKTSEQGTYLYGDDSHLNQAGVDLLATDLEIALRKFVH